MKKTWSWLRSFPNRYPWFWRNAPYAVIVGIVLAFVILAALPQGVCLGDCGAREKWCNGDCTVQCYNNIKVHKVIACSWNPAVAACREILASRTVPCPYSNNCLTQPHPFQVGQCLETGAQTCWLIRDYKNLTCCGSGGGGGGGGCTPDYAPPVIHADEAAFSPPYPLTLGQDPDRLGVAVTVTAEGGKDKNNCGGAKPKITDFKVTGIDLAESSRDWILTDLAAWYPGATILGDYPMLPDQSSLQGKSTSKATLWFHFNPRDPGFYKVTVVATQNKGSQKSSTAVITVPVYLIETTTIH